MSVEDRFFLTQIVCSIAMILVTLVTVVKVIISTKSVKVHYRVVYTILGLSLISWSLLLLSNKTDNALIASICYQY